MDEPVQTAEDIERRTAQFIWVRDQIAKLEAKHKQELEELRSLKEKLAGRIQAFMSANNVESLRTKAGTCYTSTRRTATLADPDAFMTYVISNQAFDLLDRRANSTAVQAFVQKHQCLPPGCNLNSIASVGVRRAGANQDE